MMLKAVCWSAFARLSLPLAKFYDRRMSQGQDVKERYFPIYIVGAPRSGSTLVYQAITNYFDVLYCDNIVNHLYRTFYFAFAISHRLFSDVPHNCFRSKFGATYSCGMHAPSECSGFWYRWMPKDRHYVLPNELAPKSLEQMKQSISGVCSRYRKPIVFKNLSNSLRLRVLLLMHPNMKIIYIRRVRRDIVSSILKAREVKGVDEGVLWSTKPKDYELLELLPEQEMVEKQVEMIEKEIELVCSTVDSKNYAEVKYEEFCVDPLKILEDLSNRLFHGKVYKRSGATIPTSFFK